MELVLCYRKHADHNVTTAALEVLHYLLKHAPLSLRKALVKRGVLSSVMNSRSPGELIMLCVVIIVYHTIYQQSNISLEHLFKLTQ